VNGTKHFYTIPHEVLRVNVLSLVYMLEWFKEKNKNGKFCFTSSNEAYAGGLNAFGVLPIPTPENVPLVVEDTYNPRWSYGGSKLIGELFVINYARAYNLRGCIVRPHNFYGPRAGWDHVVPEFSVRIADRVDPFILYGDSETRTFCYIDDGVRAMNMLMDSSETDKQPIGTFHIGDNNETTIGNLAEALFEIAGWKPKNITVQKAPVGSVKRRVADTTRIENAVGWKPHVSLRDGLAKTYAWYAEHRRA
jgi:nucleoside-diphosphate-sugar epimerase